MSLGLVFFKYFNTLYWDFVTNQVILFYGQARKFNGAEDRFLNYFSVYHITNITKTNSMFDSFPSSMERKQTLGKSTLFQCISTFFIYTYTTSVCDVFNFIRARVLCPSPRPDHIDRRLYYFSHFVVYIVVRPLPSSAVVADLI